MPATGTVSTGLPEDDAPAQPLSLLRVLDQEFTELHAGDPGIADSAPPIVPSPNTSQAGLSLDCLLGRQPIPFGALDQPDQLAGSAEISRPPPNDRL
jgi:hypothetical protein